MLSFSFNDNWIFIKNGEEKRISLPHDAMLEEARRENGKTGVGAAYFDGGFYTYKKSFIVPKEYENKTIILEVLGAYRNSKVYLNYLLNLHSI